MQYRRAPLFENIFGFVFVNFDCITRILYFNGSKDEMCTCILFPTLTKKAYTKVKGVLRGIKTVPRPQEFYRARRF